MEEEKPKRKAYKTKEAQNEANKRYLDNNPEIKKRVRILQKKSITKNYINNHAGIEELKELQDLINKKIEEIQKTL